jgi:hypothetical protein
MKQVAWQKAMQRELGEIMEEEIIYELPKESSSPEGCGGDEDVRNPGLQMED